MRIVAYEDVTAQRKRRQVDGRTRGRGRGPSPHSFMLIARSASVFTAHDKTPAAFPFFLSSETVLVARVSGSRADRASTLPCRRSEGSVRHFGIGESRTGMRRVAHAKARSAKEKGASRETDRGRGHASRMRAWK